MKGGFKTGVFSLGVVIVLIALIQAAQKTPLNWTPSYKTEDKIPYGTYVLFHELKTLFPENEKITGLKESVYAFFEREQAPDYTSFLFVGAEFEIGKPGLGKLLQFVHSGHDLFISARYLSDRLMDTLQLAATEFSNYKAGIDYQNDSTFFALAGRDGPRAYAEKVKQVRVFSRLNPHCRVLGYFQRGGISVPNFVAVEFGRGRIFLHLAPKLFTNYYLLQKGSYDVAVPALRHLRGQRLLWYDGQYNLGQERTPLRFILSRPALRQAWYILLFALGAFLIFKSKREQKAIPLAEPEPNLSVAFAETIGSLYYENGNPGNMVQKKIEYFLFAVRRQFQWDTADPVSPKFIAAFSRRAGMNETEVSDFLHTLIDYKEREHLSEQDLKYLNKLIEQFKQKAKLI